MKKILGILLGLLAFGTVTAADLSSPVGRWTVISDRTNAPTAVVEIQRKGKGLTGNIESIVNEDKKPEPVLCDECGGKRYNQPVVGMMIVWGFHEEEPGHWVDGHILDPKNGTTYRCKMTLIEGGEKMDVRGFVGFSLLGRTQTWVRITD